MQKVRILSQNFENNRRFHKYEKELDYRQKPWKGNNAFLHQYLKSIDYFGNKDKIRYLVPIRFWIYRNDDGSGGASFSDVDTYMNDLNYYNKINKTGIQFYISSIKEINKTKRTLLGYYIEAPAQALVRHKKQVINVHVVDGFKLRKGELRLVRGTYNYFSKAIIVRRENSSTSLSHEIGHYFGLMHPHRNYNKGQRKQEPVSRTRTRKKSKKGTPLCELRGDYLSDTPAEPKLTFLVDKDCKFTGSSLKDSWGDTYKSNPANIMSYPANYKCRNKFTIGQIAIMLYMADVNQCSKHWCTDYAKNEKYGFDSSEPNDYFEMATAIELNKINKLNFHRIFINKRKTKSDTCDWYKVELKDTDKKNIHIIVTPEDSTKNILVKLYDKNQIELSDTNEKNKPTEIKYKNLLQDWYFIKVTHPEDISCDKLIRYNLKISTY